MLLLHLVDLCLLLLHNLGQLQLVLELLRHGATLHPTSLGGCLVDLEHFLLTAGLIHVAHVDGTSSLLLDRLEMIGSARCLTDLISDA